jgi:lysyl-tRNA synthetase class 2
MTSETSEPNASGATISDEPEQIRVRKEKLERLKSKGVEPYPVGYPRTTTIAELREKFAGLPADEATG